MSTGRSASGHSVSGHPASGRSVSGRRTWRWVVVILAVAFVILVVGVLRFMFADHYPARYVDVEHTTLVKTDKGAALTLVLVHPPRTGRLMHEVKPPDDESPDHRVEIRWSPQSLPEGATEDERRTLRIELPDVDAVMVYDMRWGHPQGVRIRLSDPGA